MIILYKLKQSRKYMFLGGLLGLATLGCQPDPRIKAPAQGHPVTIFCVTPALTEIAFAICRPEQIPVVCKAADYPALVKQRPSISSLPLDIESLHTLQPDLILYEESMQDPITIRSLKGAGLRMKSIRVDTFEDLFAACDSIGTWTGNPGRAKRVKQDIIAAIRPYRKRFAGSHLRMAVFFSLSPIMAYGSRNWMDSKLTYLGIENVLGRRRTSYVNMTLEEAYELPLSQYALALGHSPVPNDIARVLGERKIPYVHLDDNLATRPSVRLAEQLKDICVGIEAQTATP